MDLSPADLHTLPDIWLPVALYAFVCSASPGPVNIVAVSSGMRFGVRRTLPQVAGATLGFALLLFGVGMGLGEVLRTTPWLLGTLKIAGSLFLCYLAGKLFMASGIAADAGLQRPPSFWDGALAQWVNPKAWVVSAAGISTYTVPGAGYSMSVLVMTLLFVLICFPSVAAWAVFGASASSVFRNDKLIRRLNMAMAGLLLLSVLSLLL